MDGWRKEERPSGGPWRDNRPEVLRTAKRVLKQDPGQTPFGLWRRDDLAAPRGSFGRVLAQWSTRVVLMTSPVAFRCSAWPNRI
jgi:hypothetical protein